MWSSRRGALALLGLAPLAACGFRPVYGRRDDSDGLAAELRAIAVPDARSQVTFELRRALLDELNPTGAPTASLYRLDYALSGTTEDLAIQLDAIVTRIDRTLRAVYSLRDLETDAVLHRGQVQRTASFNVRGEPFADRIAEEDADRRAARAVAVGVRQQLAAFFERRNPA
jgi:LPS-assembly lipoprotein